MVVYSCLDSRNFKHLKSILPAFVHLENSLQFSPEEYSRLKPDITIMDIQSWKTAANGCLPCSNSTLLWGNEEDNIRDVVTILEKGMSYLPYPNPYKKLECFLIARRRDRLGREEYRDMGILGDSRAVCDLKKTISRYAPSAAAVLVQGETGTGKELCARAIHMYSRRNGPFIPLNCAAIPEGLLESELFGTEKGAYTGSEKRIGYLEAAHRGTLFLDEIAELSLKMQSKLLRVLEDCRFCRLGSTEIKQSDLRLICGCAADLKVMMERNEFRKDLYYRINVLKITTPTLESRKEDIPILCEHLLKLSKCLKPIDSDAMIKLLSYSWPGNIRELNSVLQRAAVLSDSIIRKEDILL
ncbi:MAG: sigma 54-interacting transcriptional regulator [Spirochaetales bacterium]|nr:sigma 54-interacting transcriptional regulator [Spirochaetales bacterium]